MLTHNGREEPEGVVNSERHIPLVPAVQVGDVATDVHVHTTSPGLAPDHRLQCVPIASGRRPFRNQPVGSGRSGERDVVKSHIQPCQKVGLLSQ